MFARSALFYKLPIKVGADIRIRIIVVRIVQRKPDLTASPYNAQPIFLYSHILVIGFNHFRRTQNSHNPFT